MFFSFRVVHFVLLAGFFLAGLLPTDPCFAYSPKVPTKKYSQLFLARFYPWCLQYSHLDSTLNQKQQQILKKILNHQEDFIQKIQATYINTFAVGYLNTPVYVGQSFRILRGSPAFEKDIEALTGHKAPVLTENIVLRGFEAHGSNIFYLAVTEVNGALILQSFEHDGKSWQPLPRLTLNESAKTSLPPFLKTYYQVDNSLNGEMWLHTSEFVDEKYLNLSSQKIVTVVRAKFNLEPSIVFFKDSAHYGFYYP